MSNLVLSNGDLDGIASSAIALNHLGEAKVLILSSNQLMPLLTNEVKNGATRAYLVDFPIHSKSDEQLGMLCSTNPGVEIVVVDKHEVTAQSTSRQSITYLVGTDTSSAEKAFYGLESGLDVLLPAITSWSEGYRHTAAINQVGEAQAAEFVRNYDVLKFALMAVNLRTDSHYTQESYHKIVNGLASGLMPESIDGLLGLCEDGYKMFEEEKQKMSAWKVVKDGNVISVNCKQTSPRSGLFGALLLNLAEEYGVSVVLAYNTLWGENDDLLLYSAAPDDFRADLLASLIVGVGVFIGRSSQKRAVVSVEGRRVGNFVVDAREAISDYIANRQS